jgi:hypothetical protein
MGFRERSRRGPAPVMVAESPQWARPVLCVGITTEPTKAASEDARPRGLAADSALRRPKKIKKIAV